MYLPLEVQIAAQVKEEAAQAQQEEMEQQTASKGEQMESARGTEIKVNVQNNQGIIMSAVKPMRLSFHQIIDPSTAGGESSSGGSPFKKRLTDLFSGGAKGFGFEDIFLSASPDKTRRGGQQQTATSPLKHTHQPLRTTSLEDESSGNTHQDDQYEEVNLRMIGRTQLYPTTIAEEDCEQDNTNDDSMKKKEGMNHHHPAKKGKKKKFKKQTILHQNDEN